jgi:hypothetical protein
MRKMTGRSRYALLYFESKFQLRRIFPFFLILVTGLETGCRKRPGPLRPLPKWEFGFWCWRGSPATVRPGAAPVDVLFLQAGRIEHEQFFGVAEPWRVYGSLPKELPTAHAYWLVFRFDKHLVPATGSVPLLVRKVTELQTEARQRGVKLIGIQLDIDSPTRALPQYAAYLRAVRKDVPAELQLSITALLDWFRAGTAIGDVVDAVEEFVPQFYDLQNQGGVAGPSMIAAPIDAAKWGPKFNRFGKRFRIGVSTFGRSRLLPEGRTSYVDLKPLDLALNPAFLLESSRTEAKEQILRYRASRKTRISYADFEPGSGVEFILSTPEAIKSAVAQARRMGEYCAGVLFFRWPTFNESMVAEPDEVLAAATGTPLPGEPATLRAVDERCAVVHCTDLYLADTPALQPEPIRYVIEISSELEYFLPDERTPARMTGPGRLEFTLPPFGGRTQIHLGRAVTANSAKYTLKVIP